MKFTKKEGIILAAIFILAIAGGVVWYLLEKQKTTVTEAPKQEAVEESQNEETVDGQEADQVDTSDWKTYRNEEYGFEIKYPEGWEAILSTTKTEKRPGEIAVPITIQLIIKKLEKESLMNQKDSEESSSVAIRFTDWVDITHNDFIVDDSKDIPVKTINIGGRTAIIPDHKVREDIPTDYESYMGLDVCMSPDYILTMKPAPKGWGEYNTIRVSPACADVKVVKKIIESISFFN